MFDRKANDEYYLSKGRCPRCGGKRPLAPGRKRCFECADKSNKHTQSLRKERQEKGLCVNCGTPLTDTRFKNCEGCRARARKYMTNNKINEKAMRERRKANGLCTRCGQQPPEPGRTQCPECLEAIRQSHKKYDQNRDRRKKKYAENVRLGKCVDCSRPTDGFRRCSACLAKRRERRKANGW